MKPGMIRRAIEDDLVQLREFHVGNHLEETCHFPGEREHQISELEIDFPQLYSVDVFNQGTFWVATEHDEIIGCIGLIPDKDQPTVSWLNTFSVVKKVRGKKIGSKLLQEALGAVKTSKVRLITLAGHSEGKDVMRAARGMYEKNGFVLYYEDTTKYGESTTIDVRYYEKVMRS